MPTPNTVCRFCSRSLAFVFLCITTGSVLMLGALAAPQQHAAGSSMPGRMGHMSDHMYMTALRSRQTDDQQKADAIVVAAKTAMEPYRDYRKALADGYQIFLPNVPQHQYHFTNYEYGAEAQTTFDPLKPTSLLYKKNADGGYTLMGVMYTDRRGATEDELNQRIPLSIAHWHQHINFCRAPRAPRDAYLGPDAKFGLRGSITTKEACDAAGGIFYPHVFGWMVHVYPYETSNKKIWGIKDDDKGHDNMDRSAMGGAPMN